MGSVWGFIFKSASLGVGLAADAFSVSVVNGIRCPHMKVSKAVLIAGTFGFFQALMPMLGWFLTHTIMAYFQAFRSVLPWVSQFFLLYLGIKMLLESRDIKAEGPCICELTRNALFLQAIATSIDALLVGFTIAAYDLPDALICSMIIAAVTFVLCFLGVHWGKVLGLKLAGKATFLGGLVLILIAVDHFIEMGG